MPGESFEGTPPTLDEAGRDLADRLRTHVERLADAFGRRNPAHPAIYRGAETYLASAFESMDYSVELEDVPTRDEVFHNVVAERRGRSRADEIVVVGAHYDSVRGSPGADDNASGVAAVLELARWWQTIESPSRTVRFVCFANEEHPFFQTEAMGSRRHAERARERGEDIVAMLSLEMLGYYREAPGTQSYPIGLGWFYPERGDFVAFVGNLSSRGVVRRSIGAFRDVARHPSEGLAAPSFVPGVGLSDHRAFWQVDYEAIMVTDTAFFRNPHYHEPTDRPETLDYERMAHVVEGLQAVVETWGRPGARSR
jgi:Zn-dependent M28 family amino/carboxypeptidase